MGGKVPADLPPYRPPAGANQVRGILEPFIADRTVPRLAEGAELLGAYRGSGLRKAPLLVRTSSGRVLQLTPLLYCLAANIDGRRNRRALAARLSEQLGRPVSASNVDYLLARKLEPLGVVARSAGARGLAASAPAPAPAVLRFRVRRAVVPDRLVVVLSGGLRHLFWPPVVFVVLGALAAFDVWVALEHGIADGARSVLVEPVAFLAITALIVVSGAVHELGHAAACRYGGARPGRLGVGLYVAWPVFYSEVNDSYRLGRAGRLRTDLGGVYFNAVVAVIAIGVFLITGIETLTAFVVIQQVQIAHQFLPFVRFDGYYVVADLAGVPDPYAWVKPVLASLVPRCNGRRRDVELTPRARAIIATWALAAVPVLGLNLLLLVRHGPALGRLVWTSIASLGPAAVAAVSQGDALRAAAAGTRLLMLVLPVAGLVAFVVGLLGKVVQPTCRRLSGSGYVGAGHRPARPQLGGRVPDMVAASTEPRVLYVTGPVLPAESPG